MIRVEKAHLDVAGQSHPGQSGKNNEDRFVVSAFRASETDPTPSLLAVVADGIGGHSAGEVAAEIAVEVINQAVAESDGHQPQETLKTAIIQASERIRLLADDEKSLHGMGSTCACAWLIDNRLYIASVGDSRIYLVRDNHIHQLNIDHTWVQEAIDHGALTPEQARDHPNVHVIRRYLGSKQTVEPDLRLRLEDGENDSQAVRNQGMRLRPGDRLLLCSDGLTDLVEAGEINAALQANHLEAAVHYLVNLANRRGGHDNITVVALHYDGALPGSVSPMRRRWAVLTCLGIAFLLLVALGAAILLGIYFTRPLPGPESVNFAAAVSPALLAAFMWWEKRSAIFIPG